MEINLNEEQVTELARQVGNLLAISCKDVLTLREAAAYAGVSKSAMYRHTMTGEVPHYMPTGKMCYFNRRELEQWLQTNRAAGRVEIGDRARKYAATRADEKNEAKEEWK